MYIFTMKQNPKLIDEDTWVNSFSDEEICDLFDIDQYELDKMRNAEPTECPSCNGDGYITFEHDFTDESGKRKYKTYEVDCDYCDGKGDLTDHDRLDIEMRNKYNQLRHKEICRYAEVAKVGHI